MRVLANFTPIIKILLWIMLAISLATMILSIVILCGVTVRLEISPAQAVLMLFSTSLVTVVSLLLNTVHYHLTSTHLRLNLLFWDILGGRIRVENILNIVYKTDNEGAKPRRKMYISYIWKGEDPVIAQIAVAPKHFEKLKVMMMSLNTKIVFFDDDEKNETADSE